MNSFELSKIAGAVLAALLLIVAPKVIIEAWQASHSGHADVGYILPTDTSSATETAAAEAPAPAEEPAAAAPPADAKAAAAAPPAAGETKAAAAPAAPAAAPAKPAPATGGFDGKAVAALVAKASPDDGAAAFKKCAACHQVKKGAPSAAAPNLWGIVNRPKAAQPDFAKYSDAMKKKGGEWTYENLALFIHKPKDYLPGTKMIFNGVKDQGDIANIIAYLRTLSDSPAPLPN